MYGDHREFLYAEAGFIIVYALYVIAVRDSYL